MGGRWSKPLIERLVPVPVGTAITQFGQTVYIETPNTVIAYLHGGFTLMDSVDVHFLLDYRWNVYQHHQTAYVRHSGKNYKDDGT